jgi:hypothetical protein
MDPGQAGRADTNGNITGQAKTLDSLRDMLGFLGAAAGAGIPPDRAPDIYRAAWMRGAETGVEFRRGTPADDAEFGRSFRRRPGR